MSDATKLPLFAGMFLGQWSTKNASAPTLNSPISISDNNLTVSDALTDENGAVVTGAFLMGVRRKDSWAETIWVPAGAVSADGLTYTSVVRGINPCGIDYTVGFENFASAHDAGEPVFCVISAIIPELIRSALQGLIATGAAGFWIGTDGAAAETVTVYRTTGVGTKKGFMRWYVTSGKTEYSDDGVTWGAIADAVASVVFKIAATDTTAGYAKDKIVAGDGVSVTQTGTGGNETLVLASTYGTPTTGQAVFTPAYLTGGTSAESTVGNWTGYTDGSFRVSIDGVVRDVTGINFTVGGLVTMADIATYIQTALRAVTGSTETITWSTDHFIISSVDTTSASAVTVLSAAGVGTDISGAGAFAGMDGDTGHGVPTGKVPNLPAQSGLLPSLGADGLLNMDLLGGKVAGAYMVAGETINCATNPQAVYVSDGTVGTVGKIFKADANDTTNMAVRFLGFVSATSVLNDTVFVQMAGIVSGFTGLTRGVEYYLSQTAGAIVVGAINSGNPSIPIGIAISATEILIYKNQPIAGATYTYAAAGAPATTDTTLSVGFRVRAIQAVIIASTTSGCVGQYTYGEGSACVGASSASTTDQYIKTSANLGYLYAYAVSPSNVTFSVLAITANTVTIRRVETQIGIGATVYLTMS